MEVRAEFLRSSYCPIRGRRARNMLPFWFSLSSARYFCCVGPQMNFFSLSIEDIYALVVIE